MPFPQGMSKIAVQNRTTSVYSRGYQEASAVPMSIDKAHQLIDYLDQKAASASSPCQRLLHERDALTVDTA